MLNECIGIAKLPKTSLITYIFTDISLTYIKGICKAHKIQESQTHSARKPIKRKQKGVKYLEVRGLTTTTTTNYPTASRQHDIVKKHLTTSERAIFTA